jgi:BASS family bile acid:Na+ symporter
MNESKGFTAGLSRVLQANFFRLLIGSYAAAAVWPALGLLIRDVSLARPTLMGESMNVSLPVLLLAALLFNAGLGAETSRLWSLARRPLPLLAGLAGNLLVPIAFIFAVTGVMRPWHNPDEVQNILVGLALVASMPIAGSSTAWSQNADGDLALSVSLVVGSTLLSPLTTPLALHAVGWMASGDYAASLHDLASHATGAFLAVAVILPTVSGIAVRLAVGPRRVDAAKPWLKTANAAVLLLLNYSNASASLPQAVSRPDLDFLVVTLGITLALCALGFSGGWAISRLLGADSSRKASLMFGLGMNNNGTGLVLASMALAGHPRVMLPIIFYNLVQHLVAAGVGSTVLRGCGGPPGPTQRSRAGRLDFPRPLGRARRAVNALLERLSPSSPLSPERGA